MIWTLIRRAFGNVRAAEGYSLLFPMAAFFKHKKETVGDHTLADLPRGEEGRSHSDNHQSHGYFKSPEELAKIGFTDHSGQNFLGIVGGTTAKIVRDDGRSEFKTTGGHLVGCNDDRHRTVVAGSRSGKGRSVLIPELLTNAGSAIVIDPKGENTAITARYRAEVLKQKVFAIDPFRITPPHCEPYRAQFNPMKTITMESLSAVEDAGLIADALIVPSNSKDTHWDDTARAFIEGVMLFVAFGDFAPEERTLLTVAELIACKHHDSINGLLRDMIEMGGADNRVAAAALAIKEMGSEEQGSVISNARKNLKFLDYDAIYGALSHHDFDLVDLKNDPMTIYLVLPARHMSSCKQMLRLFVNLTLAAMEENPIKPRYPVQLILDEVAVLGYMKELETAVGLMAGLGLRITTVLQDLGQLKSLYKDRYETFLGNSGVLQFFGTVDYFTSEWISKYLGKTTIRVSERGGNSIDAKNRGSSGMHYKQQMLDLMTPEEVRRYFARDDHLNRQLVCIPGKRPYVLQRANYDQHAFFKGRFDVWQPAQNAGG